MALTKEQRKKRKKYLGSSDIAALMECSPWGTTYDLYLEKTGQVKMEKDKPYLTAGQIFESGVLEWASIELEQSLTKSPENISEELKLMSHPDAEIPGGDPVEAKTTGLFAPVIGTWGEPMTDEMPDYVVLQCQAHLICSGRQTCYVPTFIGDRKSVV